MQKQTTPKRCPFELFDTIFERLLVFVCLPVIFALGVLYIKRDMENQKHREVLFEAMDKRIEAREALNAAQ